MHSKMLQAMLYGMNKHIDNYRGSVECTPTTLFEVVVVVVLVVVLVVNILIIIPVYHIAIFKQ